MNRHHLTRKYLERMAEFAVSFPTAHAFLARIEADGPRYGMWLSTAVNAHLYLEDAFLAYLKFESPAALVVSPRFNGRIAMHTTDESNRLFPSPFDNLIKDHEGFSAKWATREADNRTILKPSTPAAFFEALFEAVAAL